ncbi:uncharacterized protein LOC120104873 [Phoenix dactylifera]|uniref:Uncharacterized protein LOC120104873 n=1 Tax=Phoenix dactylifera TaxID=42345 RepID=A0A8B8ZEX8_PHODC|nr:uncharacterized protein LOC120104873 [Phoenix dactylifera]
MGRCGHQGHKIAECPRNRQVSQSDQRPQARGTQQVQASPTPAQSAQPSSPKQQQGERLRTQGRIYALTQQDAQASNIVVSEYDLHVSTPASSGTIGNQVCKTCPVQIVGRDLPADLIIIDMYDFDTILGKDWLASHFAAINRHEKRVVVLILSLEFSTMHIKQPVRVVDRKEQVLRRCTIPYVKIQ